jgi:hypothetical protein
MTPLAVARKVPGLYLLLLILSVPACAPQQPGVISSTVNYEGLAEVSRPYFDVAQVRPGADFGGYDGVIVNAPELAFRMPDRSQQQFPLDEDQKRRFQAVLAEAFTLEFASLQNLVVKDQPGSSVLELTVRVENITAAVPTGRSPQLGFALSAVGEATLILELHDSESGEILARGVDTRAVQGAAVRQGGEMATRWEDIEKLCTRWASMARTRLDALVEQT